MEYIEGGVTIRSIQKLPTITTNISLDSISDSNLGVIATSLDKIAKHLEHIDEVLTESKTRKRRKRRVEE